MHAWMICKWTSFDCQCTSTEVHLGNVPALSQLTVAYFDNHFGSMTLVRLPTTLLCNILNRNVNHLSMECIIYSQSCPVVNAPKRRVSIYTFLIPILGLRVITHRRF